jgi:CheY-like chemotaxis protein
MRARPVLIVDDTAAIRDTLRMALDLEGYDVVVANGREAMERLDEGADPGLVLLGFSMPVMDGEAFRAERANLGVAAETSVVVFAAARRKARSRGSSTG